MSIVAETATLAWGYTMDDVDRITRWTISSYRRSTRSLDSSDRYETAWHAVVEHLYASSERPTQIELRDAGSSAIRTLINDQLRHHGITVNGRDAAPNFMKYWHGAGGSRGDGFSERIVERLALPQVLGQLTGAQYEAVAMYAAHGSCAAAADVLGITETAFYQRLRGARAKVADLWFEHETPRRAAPASERDQVCRYGHSREQHGYRRPTGAWRCRMCERFGARRRNARER